MAPELYDKLVEYYKDDPNVKVIIDRRKSERRGPRRGARRRAPRGPRPPPHARAGRVPAARHDRVKLVVHVDGGARGNPGPAAAAAVLSTPDGEVVDEAHELLGVVTNNVAEYRGLLLGLARARELGADEVEVVNDSELVAKQVNGVYKVKHPDMRPLHSAGDGGAARLPALEGALGPAGPERRRRRAGQPGARRGPLSRACAVEAVEERPSSLPIPGACRLPSPPLRPTIVFPA